MGKINKVLKVKKYYLRGEDAQSKRTEKAKLGICRYWLICVWRAVGTQNKKWKIASECSSVFAKATTGLHLAQRRH